VKDTCGSGDMVSVGVIDWFLRQKVQSTNAISLVSLREGVVAGQRLAAANCAFVGARGLFSNRNVAYVRSLLNAKSADQFDLFE
jgi:fructokinase